MPRRCLLLVLLVLLPLRGWAGVAMATSMAVAQPLPSAAATVALECHDHGVLGPSDSTQALREQSDSAGAGHHDAMASPSAMPHGAAQGLSGDPHPQGTPHGSASCANCVFCQLCHTVALAPALSGLGLSWAPVSLPQADLPTDLSATPLPGDKPPIA